jgi:hypothetical protein
MMKLALFNYIPAYCPNCGKSLESSFQDKLAKQDFYSGTSHSCDCGLKYAYVDTDTIYDASLDIEYYANYP